MIKIKRNRQIQKNIKQNLKFYGTSEEEAEEAAQGAMRKFMVIVLSITVTVSSILCSTNILFRIPDFFRFEFDRMAISNKLGLGISGTDLGSFFSGFMLHSDNTFELVTEHEGITGQLFNGVEAAMMNNFRVLLDVLLIIGVASLVLAILFIVMMQRNRMARSLRLALNIGLVIYIAILAGMAWFFNIHGGDLILRNSMSPDSLNPNDLLLNMFDERFTLDSTIAIAVISFIIMMIFRYIVWKLTEQKGIFSEGLKGVAK